LIAGLGKESIILGLPWLRRINPEYNEPRYGYSQSTKTISRIIKAKGSPRYAYGQNIWIRAKTSVSQHLTHKKEGDPEQKTLDKLLPEQYREYRRIFKKEALERFPESRPWDHVIELKMDFMAKDCRVYPLSPAEQKKLDKFLD
ncbi:hypothetical protein L208DRAFT_1064880, partial [Tricholoma matsutake]